VFTDRDGTITGTANSYIVNMTGTEALNIDAYCEVKSDWNAAVCTGDIGRMTVGGGGGAVGFGGFGGGGGAGGPPGGAGAAAAARPAAPPAPPVFEIAPGGGRIRGRAPAGEPIVLSRNGNEFPVNGETNIRAGSEFTVSTTRPSLNLTVKELDAGAWVMFELPGFTTAAAGTEQSSLDALRSASATSYFKDGDTLWVKLVSTGDILGSGPGKPPGPGDSLQVSR
jgi:cell migration-inducing and hyaluronan-binding protein